MKTKLLKKWRQEAVNRIGVFKTPNKTFSVVFDKTLIGDVSNWDENYNEGGYQIVEENIKTLLEAMAFCDEFRRAFILREARKEWNEKYYGSKKRYY